MSWVRLWADMPTDPKWRVIAKRSGRPISEVMSVFVIMMTHADRTQANASERGELMGWSHEDVAATLDVEPEHIAAIYDAMQGKVLENKKLTGWGKRQPKREDSSAERAKEWRERKRTQANAEKRPDSDSDSDSESKSPLPPSGAFDDMPSNVRPIKNWSEAFAAPAEHEGVQIADGKLVLVNGTRVRWLAAFGGDEAALDLALIEVRGQIQPNSRAHTVEAQAERHLARMVRDRSDRDRRYREAAANNATAKTQGRTPAATMRPAYAVQTRPRQISGDDLEQQVIAEHLRALAQAEKIKCL